MLTRLHAFLDRYSLRGQMRARMLLIFAFSLLAVGVAATLNYRYLIDHGEQLRAESLRHFYTASINRLETRWQEEAANLRRGIEFLGVLEHPGPAAWSRLIAYLGAQGEDAHFDTVLIFADDHLLFAHGREAGEISTLEALETTPGWHVSRALNDIHRVLRQPLWLGPGKRGVLIVLRPINADLLTEIQAPNTRVSLSMDTVSVASQFSMPGEQDLHSQSIPWMQAPGAPHLLISHSPAHALSLLTFMRQPAIVLLVIGGLLWWVLGRWLTSISGRIDHIRAACALFPRQHVVDNAIRAQLDNARRPDELGEVSLALEGLMHSVSQKHRAALAHLDTLEALDEAVLEFDAESRVVQCSGAWLRMTRQTHNEGDFLPFFHAEDRALLADALEGLMRGEKHQVSTRVRMPRAQGEEAWLECRLLAVTDGVRGILRDVTQSYLQEKRITHMALHDSLTGLPNRVLFEDRVKIALRMAERMQKRVGLCFIDLDHFKHINDTLGHKVGDRLLIEFAGQVRTALRQGDTLGRWGGDEFVLLLPDMPSEDAIREVTGKVLRITQNPVRIDDQEFNVTFSMGVAVFPDNAMDAENLMSQADRAMFYSKAQGRNAVTFYSDMAGKGMGKKELYIQNRLITAIKQGRISAWFQPIVDAKSQRVIGVEALARWHEDGLGWISPATFIPMAENLGLIRDLGEGIWRDTLAAGRAWRDRGYALSLAVNISKRQLFMPFLTEKLLEDVEASGLRARDIVLEVTESVALLDVEYAAERLNELAEAGFRLALDDFGTGYSSLSQLHEMPVGELKIDISFVRRIHDPQGARLLQAIVQMTDALKIDTVAEGVEDAETARLLASYGVNALQGFHFAKPMPREELDAWLAERMG